MTDAAINRSAIQAMIASQAAFSISDTFVKLTAAHLPAGQIMAVRGIFGTLLVGGLIIGFGEWASLRKLAHPMALARAGLESVISVLFVLSIAAMPIANYTAIIQSAPLIITALSVMFFGAPVGWRRWMAVFAGFVGVLMVAKPEAGGFGVAAFYAIACAFLVAVRDMVTRRVPAHIPSHAVALGTCIATTLMGAILALAQPASQPSSLDIISLAVAALAVNLANFCVILACRRADLSVVAPFRYSVMPFALLSGYLVWGNIPDWFGIFGIVLICASGLYAFHRERVRARASTGTGAA